MKRGCFPLTDLPVRQPRRISISDLCAGGISYPKSLSVGPTVLTDIFPPSGHPLTPIAASLVAALPSAGAPGGRVVERVGSGATADFIARENLSLTLRRQPASDALREVSESAPCVRLHAHSMEKTNAERVASAYVKERG